MKIYKYAVAFAVFFAGINASAQEPYYQDELNTIREELRILQRQVYRSAKSGDTQSAEAPAEQGNYAPAADVKALGEYDQIIRNLNGKIDEMEHKISQLEKRMETINKDFDVRMRLLEGKKINGVGTSAPAGKKYDAPVASGAPKFVTGGAVKGESLSPLRTSDGTAKEIYDTGLDALHADNFEVATQNFSTIIEQYPNDRLAGNAYYWLGEVYYKQGDYKNSAITFANGYQNYRDNPKAADNLFKLGMSMKGLNKKDEACSAFVNLEKEFPSANNDLKKRAKDEAKKLGCK